MKKGERKTCVYSFKNAISKERDRAKKIEKIQQNDLCYCNFIIHFPF